MDRAAAWLRDKWRCNILSFLLNPPDLDGFFQNATRLLKRPAHFAA